MIARQNNSAPTSTPAATAQPEASPNTVTLTPAAIKAAGVAVETVEAGGLSAEILASATVTAPPQGQAVLTARAAGAVTRIFKRLGDPVRAGEALAIVTSRDAAQIAADRTSAAAKATLASKNMARER
ncbi:MAG: efflux RND transporter periplasmic adaptor subunit, partial [Sphingomonadales bacterium]|nr:efflux RND transporter periplasmic adaptor subunit [Sphingomonadales bacterium]